MNAVVVAVVVVVPLMLLSSGLSAGIMVGAMLGSVPLLHVLAGREYLRVHQFLADRYEPFQPICMAVSTLCAVALALFAGDGVVRSLALLSAGCTVAVMAVSATRNVPIKRELRTLDPEAPPAEPHLRDLRLRWARWSRLRTVLAVAALVVNIVTVGALLAHARPRSADGAASHHLVAVEGSCAARCWPPPPAAASRAMLET